jgi:hypothetical protein
MECDNGESFRSIRRESFVEAYGIPEAKATEDELRRQGSSHHSITVSDIDVSDNIDRINNNDSNTDENHRADSSQSSSWQQKSQPPPNFAGGNTRRRGNRNRAALGRRSSTGSLEQSFGDISLQSFTSESSFTSTVNNNEGSMGLEVANLLFVTDAEAAKIICGNDEENNEQYDDNNNNRDGDDNIMQKQTDDRVGGTLAILGTGAFSTVRLAWRKTAATPPPPSVATNNNCRSQQHRRSIVRVASQDSDSITSPDHTSEQLVAVKMIQKSILKQMKIMEKGPNNRLTVRTAFDDIEKEIATMKRLCHPNCVQLFEVIDSVESDKLYMVLEYISLGEILSNVDGTDRYMRKGFCQKVKGVTPEGYFDEKNAALYFVDILHGLAYLHRHSICHRDLKPEK